VADSLRSFRTEDADVVVELSRHALARPDEQVGNPVWATRDQFENEVADWEPGPEETLVVAEEDGEVVGFGGLEVLAGFPHAELFGPLVAEGHRGQKIGALLLEASLRLARQHGVARVSAAVGTRNVGGRLLLERTGFRRRGTPQATFRLTPAEHRPRPDGPPDVHVRRGTPDDLGRALEVYRECFPDGRFPESVWAESLRRRTVYVAEAEDRLLGILHIDPNDRWIYHVGVTAGDRNRGVGSYLLSESLDDYWNRHPGETLGLDVATDNVPAIRLYRHQGFAPWLVVQPFELAL
jgi:ribosomal protein S18 acetylase RimI-like enzyme